MSLNKPGRETDREIRDYINSYSPSFCLAKWYNATIWLGSGMTTSCHHPLPHAIDKKVIPINPTAIHNTPQKKLEREMMLKGEKPAGCEYCWKIESMEEKDAISDRVYKSKIYSEEDLDLAFTTSATEDFNLRTLEISFDRTCQFACSYCNPAFSSSWVKDINTNGPYLELESDGRNHFTHGHDSAQLYKFGQSNPYVDAFFQWWESDLHQTLDELRITGGEPLMSGYTWQLLDWFKQNKGRSNTRLAINSNLGTEVDIDRLFSSVDAPIDLYTSNEAVGNHAEYIRDGLVWDDWTNSIELICDTHAGQKLRGLHIMCTVNALCLESLPEFLDCMVQWKRCYGKNFPNFTLNILRFPSFQSALVLPDVERTRHKNNLEAWLAANNTEWLHEHERNHVQRLIDYLDVVKTPHVGAAEQTVLQKDFKRFFHQYDIRREKSFIDTFPTLKNWYNSL